MRLLVITPTLGESEWLAQTVQSVAPHVTQGCHVLVAPAAVVPVLARRFPAVVVVAEEAGGLGMYAAINTAAASKSDWDALTYINDDDLLLPAFAWVAETVAARPGKALVAYGGVRLIDRQGVSLGAVPISRTPSHNRDLYTLRLEPVYQHGTIFSRAAWEFLGGFDSSFRYCGDSEILARACTMGLSFSCVTADPVAAFRLRPGQLTKHRGPMEDERLRVDTKLGSRTPRPDADLATARRGFRLGNLWIYLDRIRRHGFVSFDQLLTRLG